MAKQFKYIKIGAAIVKANADEADALIAQGHAQLSNQKRFDEQVKTIERRQKLVALLGLNDFSELVAILQDKKASNTRGIYRKMNSKNEITHITVHNVTYKL